MASSQVEIIIASSSPFGRNAKKINIVVRDHNDFAPTWVSRVAKNNNLGRLSFTKRRLNNFCGDHKEDDDDSSSLSALVSPRHSRIIDRWAAGQAREVVTTLDQNEEVDVAEVFDNFPSRSSSFNSRREVSLSPPPHSDHGSSSDSDEKISNLGASSLVQIWEKRLNQSNSTKPNTPSPVSTPKQLVEHRGFGFGQVINSPRIRGRQAFNDLIMQFESDRHRELNNLAERGAVSKFTQRGRIQSLLRLRLLQRGVAAFDPFRQKSTAHEGKKQQQGSAVMQLKERFNTGDEVQRNSSLAEVSDPRSLAKEIVSSTTQLNSVSQTSTDNKEGAHPSSGVTFQGTFFEAQNDDLKETVGAFSSMADSNANETADDKVEARDQQYDIAEISYDEMVEEEEASDQNCDEARASYDWISTISRPKSYWEERRREWYSKVLDFGSDNDDRRKLLERRTVSTVLSSDFRERMDKLMHSHRGTQTELVSNQYDEEDQEGSMEQLMAFFHERVCARGSPQENGRERGEEDEVKRNEEEKKAEEQEEESMISGSDHELGDYQSSSSVHTPSSSTWSYRDNDGGDDSDRVASISSPPLPNQSLSFYQDTRQYSSSTIHPSIEMEFIYDLRGQMEKLFCEMFELRKSIKNCTDMQVQIQQSKNQEVHRVKEEEKKFHNKTPKKGNCCICYEKEVNSVLYRCGHMCACLKCANELQWKSGKCPICQAPIIDVIRVYTDTESYMMDRV